MPRPRSHGSVAFFKYMATGVLVMTVYARAVRLAVTIVPAEVVEDARKLWTLPIVRSVFEKEKMDGMHVALVVGKLVGENDGGTVEGGTLGLLEGTRKGLVELCGFSGAVLDRREGT